MEFRLPEAEWELGGDQGPLPRPLKGTKYVKQPWQRTAILQEWMSQGQSHGKGKMA